MECALEKHPCVGCRRLPLKGAMLVARRSRFHGILAKAALVV
jgi:hypothetical protein